MNTERKCGVLYSISHWGTRLVGIAMSSRTFERQKAGYGSDLGGARCLLVYQIYWLLILLWVAYGLPIAMFQKNVIEYYSINFSFCSMSA